MGTHSKILNICVYLVELVAWNIFRYTHYYHDAHYLNQSHLGYVLCEHSYISLDHPPTISHCLSVLFGCLWLLHESGFRYQWAFCAPLRPQGLETRQVSSTRPS